MSEIPKGHIAADAWASLIIVESDRGISVNPEYRKHASHMGEFQILIYCTGR